MRHHTRPPQRWTVFAAPGLLLLSLVAQAAGPASAIAAGLALFIAGLPHGAFDEGGRLLIHPRYVLRYLGAGLLAAVAFLTAPVLTLALFLALSAWHFLHEPAAGAWLRRVAVACLAIGGSALWRPSETAAVFAALCGTAIPPGAMIALAVIGGAGLLAALGRLAFHPRDVPLWVMVASPALLHPVLATGMIFMLGHAGLVSSALIQQRSWGWLQVGAVVVGSTLLAAGAVFAFPLPTIYLPYAAAAALAIIIPHLLPPSWLSPARDRQPCPDQSSQAATSPAT